MSFPTRQRFVEDQNTQQTHANQRMYHNQGVATVKVWSRIIRIEVVRLEARQSVKVVLNPLPHIAIDIVEPQGCWRVQVDRLRMGN